MKKVLYFSLIFISILSSSYFLYYIPNSNELKNSIYLEKSQEMKILLSQQIELKQENIKTLVYLISQDFKIVNALKTNSSKEINYEKILNFLHENGNYKNLWFQIVAKDGTSFYRSWTSKKDDYLLDSRDDLKELLKDPKPIQSISSGLFDLTFKTICPVYNGDVLLGFVELISKFNSIANTLQEQKIEPLFILNEEKSKKITEPFSNIFIHNNYIVNKNASKDILYLVEKVGIEKFSNIKDFIHFSKYLVTDFKIKDVNGDNLGLFLMFFDKNNLNMHALIDHKNNYLIMIFIFLVIYILIFLYFLKTSYAKELNKEVVNKTNILQKQQKRLESLLKIYDKNVIFSKTDLTGIITHASSAFCKISGFTKDELIGNPHSIVRHPDMSKETFKNIWQRIVRQEKVTSEIKNLRKDGSYYWVIADIEPLYDELNNHIGYYSVREDITANKDIEELQREVIFTMGSIAESRSKETGEHVKRVAKYSKVLALAYGLSNQEASMLELASPMHDIGKIAIPDEILNKPSKLTFEEFEIMKTHAQKGFEMLNVSERPLFKAASLIAITHHEKYDGSGYPNGLKEDNIPIFGRITALADVFDAISSDRCYKKAWQIEKVLEFIKSQRGKHFDPKLVDILFENLDEILKIKDSHKDL